MEDSKERQLDSVFTAKEVGEYRFCFNNEMSTFAEKMVDFEIAVRPGPSPSFSCTRDHIPSLPRYPVQPPGQAKKIILSGRKRIPLRPTPRQTRHLARTNLRSRRIHPENQRPPLHHQPQPEILSNARESQLQYSQKHGRENIQF